MKTILELAYLPHQLKVFDSNTRHVVYVKGRRTGGTKGAVMRVLELGFENAKMRHLWIDTSLRNIDKLVSRYFLPLLRGLPHRWNRSTRVLRFGNESYCDFGSAEQLARLEGFAYDCIWINEAGLVLKNEDLYYQSVLPMLIESPQSRLFCIGVPKGGGLFQRMYEWGQDQQKTEWSSYRHPSFCNPLLPPQQLKALREHMPEVVYRQEILAEFVDSEYAVFQNIDQLVLPADHPAGPHVDHSYVLGVDLARYHDYTVVWVGDIEQGHAVFCDRFQRLPWQTQIERIARIAKRFNDARAYVDASGVGDPICEALSAYQVAVHPVVFTAARRQQLLEHLALGIEQTRLRIIDHPQTQTELRSFQFRRLSSGQVRAAAPSGQHDDCVMALALCYWGMRGHQHRFITGALLESTADE